MVERARGSISDRPWGLTLGSLGLSGLTGRVRVQSGPHAYEIGFARGSVVETTSSQTIDSPLRVAVTQRLIKPAMVVNIAKRLAVGGPGQDEVAVIAEVANLSEDHATRLRRRVLAHISARTFALEQGEFVVTDEKPAAAQVALDIRPIVYLGALMNMSEQRIMDDLHRLGTHFQLKVEALDELPHYGFTDAERGIAYTLVGGATLAALQATHRDLEPKTLLAVVYTLVSGLACEAGDGAIVIAVAPVLPPPIAEVEPEPEELEADEYFEPEPEPDEYLELGAEDVELDDLGEPAPPAATGVDAEASKEASGPKLAVPRTRTDDLMRFVGAPREPAAPALSRSRTPTWVGAIIPARRPATSDGNEP